MLMHSSLRTVRSFVLIVCTSLLVACAPDLTDLEYIERAKTAMDEGDLKSAVIDLKSALQTNPANPEARWLLGNIYLKKRFGKEAEKEFINAEKNGIERTTLILPLGEAWFLQGQYDKVLKEIRVNRAFNNTQKAQAMRLRGDAYRDLGRFEQAEEAYNKSLNFDQQYFMAYVELARMHLRSLDFQKTSEALRKAQALSSSYEVLQMEGELSYAAKDYEAAKTAFDQVIKADSDYLQGWLGLGLAEMALENLEGAQKIFDQLLKESPDHMYVNYLRSVVAFRQNDYEASLNYSNKVLNAVPNHTLSRVVAGSASFALEKYEQAVQHLKRVIRQVPDHEESRRLLSAALVKLGSEKEALELLKGLSAEGGSDADLLLAIGSLATKTGDMNYATDALLKAATLQPDNSDIRRQLGMAKLSLGDFQAALENLRLASELTPGFGKEEVYYVQALIRANEYQKALGKAEELKQALPQQTAGYVLAGVINNKLENYAQAEEDFKQALAIKPGSEDAAFNLASLYFKQEKYSETESVLVSSLEDEPNSHLLMNSLITLYAKTERVDKSREYLEKIIEAYPEDDQSKLILARLSLSHGDPVKAFELANGLLIKHPEDPRVLEIVGRSQAATNRHQEATEVFVKLAEITPKSPMSHYWLGASLLKVGEFEKAKSAFRQVLAIDSDNLAAGMNLARIHLQDKNTAEAEIIYKRFAKKYPEDLNLKLLEARLAGLKDDWTKAVNLFEQVYAKQPSDNYVLELARAYQKLGKPSNAISKLDEWLQANPGNLATVHELGRLQLAAGKYSAARKTYSRLINSYPESWVGYAQLSRVLLAEKSFSSALENAEKAHNLFPENIDVLDVYGQSLLGTGDTVKAHRMFERGYAIAPGDTEIALELLNTAILTKNSDLAAELVNTLKLKSLSEGQQSKFDDLQRSYQKLAN